MQKKFIGGTIIQVAKENVFILASDFNIYIITLDKAKRSGFSIVTGNIVWLLYTLNKTGCKLESTDSLLEYDKASKEDLEKLIG